MTYTKDQCLEASHGSDSVFKNPLNPFLNVEQKKILIVINHHIQNNETPLCIHIDGRTGTGKNWVIVAISHALDSLQEGNNAMILQVAPTGIVAHAIKIITYHCTSNGFYFLLLLQNLGSNKLFGKMMKFSNEET